MEKKTCLVVYIGNGFSKEQQSYNGSYTYSVDMRDNRKNHKECIYNPLFKLGYSIDTSLVTNKHEFYEGFKKEYGAINLQYDDITPEDEKNLEEFFYLKIDRNLGWGPGQFKSGGRFLKLKEKIPEYDLYVFVRADASFKITLDKLNVDYDKINYLWPETDYRFFTEGSHAFYQTGKNERWFWDTYKRINGNVLNVIPKKYVNIFLNYFWLEHLSVYFMTESLHPLITLENDINLMCGDKNCYVTDVNVCENPVFTFNKTIIKTPVNYVKNEEKIFFDVGANNGDSSTQLAIGDPNLKVFAFEPVQEMISIIKERVNKLSNYHIIDKAVSNFNGYCDFNVAGQSDWGCSSFLNFSEKSKKEWENRTDFVFTDKIEVDVIRLDDFIKSNDIKKINYLHVDTQGSDLNVLVGLGNYIKIVQEGNIEAANKEDILYDGQNTKEESIKFLEKNRFEITNITCNDHQCNEVNISFKNRIKIKQYIVTYNNSKAINECIESIFNSLNEYELSVLELYVINNHTNFELNKKFINRVKILNNETRPDFSTGHLSRSWNQSIINGFKDLNNPDCDILITNQDDTIFTKNYIEKLIRLHCNYDLLQFGCGDNFISYTPKSIKRIGLWDERFCNIGYQEADYFNRAFLYLKDTSSINDDRNNRILNEISTNDYPIKIIQSGFDRKEDYHIKSMEYHKISELIYNNKWNTAANAGFINSELNPPKINSYILYPYFEKDIAVSYTHLTLPTKRIV